MPPLATLQELNAARNRVKEDGCGVVQARLVFPHETIDSDDAVAIMAIYDWQQLTA
jgi:hypothetical protein